MSAHDHCRNCIFKYCTTTEECPVVICKFECGMKLHECKAIDHGSICQSQKVRCVNSYYGCPAVLPRSQLSPHIQNCPASIIQCTKEWGRNPLYSEERLKWVPFQQPNPTLVKGYLDVELALHDQKVINKMVQDRCKQGVVRKLSERHDPSMKLSYERAKFCQDEIKRAPVVENDFSMDVTDLCSAKENLKIRNVEDNNRMRNVEENNLISSPENETSFLNNDVPECPKLLETRSGLGLNLNIEMIPKFGRHSFIYRVPCGQVLHRREYPAHFKNVHSDIHSGLGWIQQRCPLAQYGCPYVCDRLLPSTREGSVVFSQDLGAFGVRAVRNTDHTSECFLLYLPSELLEEICKWLDGFSLNNLLRTCRTLHHNLIHLLPKQGIVVAQWKKRVYEDGSASWTLGKKVWSFTTAFSEVHQWVFSDLPGLAIHFEKCPFYQPYVPEKPFTYDVSLGGFD